MKHTLTIDQAQRFYPGQILNWPITTKEAHALLACMGLEYDVRHLAEFASDSDLNLQLIGCSCVWTPSDVEVVAAQLARLGHFTKWAAGWQAFGVPLITAESARALACAVHGTDTWRHFAISIHHPNTSMASVCFEPQREAAK